MTFAIINKIYRNYGIVYFRSLSISCTTTPLRPANRKRELTFSTNHFLVSIWSPCGRND